MLVFLITWKLSPCCLLSGYGISSRTIIILSISPNRISGQSYDHMWSWVFLSFYFSLICVNLRLKANLKEQQTELITALSRPVLADWTSPIYHSHLWCFTGNKNLFEFVVWALGSRVLASEHFFDRWWAIRYWVTYFLTAVATGIRLMLDELEWKMQSPTQSACCILRLWFS